MSQTLAQALIRLLDSGGTVPASAFTAAQRRELDELARRTGAIRVKTVGKGSSYQILYPEVLGAHLKTLRPTALDELDPNLPRRAANIAHGRDSKIRSCAHEIHYLLMKAIGPGVFWETGHGEAARRLDLSTQTAIAGAAVLAVREDDGWQSRQALWLVENQALFDVMDWLPQDTEGSLAYYAGQVPNRLLRWLAGGRRATEVVLFPDYDGVGLLNYARLRETCLAPCSLWLMPRWRSLLATYGNAGVWRSTQAEFQTAAARLVALGVEEEVLELCRTLSREGLALEHEAVWLAEGGSGK